MKTLGNFFYRRRANCYVKQWFSMVSGAFVTTSSITAGKVMVLLASSGWSAEVPLNILPCTGPAPQ